MVPGPQGYALTGLAIVFDTPVTLMRTGSIAFFAVDREVSLFNSSGLSDIEL
jgi:hypothetical protein